jgi:hypothetical protein
MGREHCRVAGLKQKAQEHTEAAVVKSSPAFLRQMADLNAKVTCSKCAKSHVYS